jgi:beta-lactamase class C
MLSVLTKHYSRSVYLSRSFIIILAFFLFTTFFIERKTGYSSNQPNNRIAEILPADYYMQSLENLTRYYDNYMKTCIANSIIPGAAMAITYKDNVLLINGYGVKQQGTDDSVDIHTAFRIGSVSKGFAAVLTGIVNHENLIDWDDKVSAYLPDFKHKDTATFNKLTVKQILSQTSGFPTHTFTDLLDGNISYNQIKEQLKTVPFSTQPGIVYSYQNVVFSLIDEILKKSTGVKYEYLLRDKIFVPLGMKDASSEYVSLIVSGNYACPHLNKRNSWKSISNNTRYYATTPASGINASIADMTQWLLALNGSKPEVIDPDILNQVYQPVVEIPMKRSVRRVWGGADKLNYAMGWRVAQVGNKTFVFHGGHVDGFCAEIGFCPEDQIGIVILINANSPLANNLVPEFFSNLYRFYLPELIYLNPQKI